MSQPNGLFRPLLFLLGAIGFARVSATVLHELGHALAMLATGGEVRKIVINPFAWSTTYYGTKPSNPIFITASGLLFAIFIGLLLWGLAWWRNTPRWSLFGLVGLFTLINNGAYWITDAVFKEDGDATRLIQSGISPMVVLWVGMAAIAIAVGLGVLMLPALGIGPEDSLIKRAAIFLGATLPWQLVGSAFTVQLDPTHNLVWGITGCISVFAALFVALLSSGMQNTLGVLRNEPAVSISWEDVMWALLLGVLATIIPLFLP